jgi:hypothetical protein
MAWGSGRREPVARCDSAQLSMAQYHPVPPSTTRHDAVLLIPCRLQSNVTASQRSVHAWAPCACTQLRNAACQTARQQTPGNLSIPEPGRAGQGWLAGRQGYGYWMADGI